MLRSTDRPTNKCSAATPAKLERSPRKRVTFNAQSYLIGAAFQGSSAERVPVRQRSQDTSAPDRN